MSYQEHTTLMAVANRLAIGDLTARYNRALEEGDVEAWIGTFVQEGVLEGTDGETFSGHRNLVRFFRVAPPDRIRVTTDAQVDVDGVHARQECRFLTLRVGSNGDGALEVEAVGRYRDVLTYERGRWFSARAMVADLSRGR
jgi:SnoaL-like domain